MKKKTLVVLLIIPFIIGLLSFVSVMILNNTVAADIVDILWDYEENEGFKISNKPYKLKAEPVIDEDLLLAPHSDELVWKVKNIDNSNVEYASITKEGDQYYLNALKEGIVQVTCSNVRGTKSKFFNAHIYENGAIVVNRKQKASGKNVDPTYYIGQYDLSYSDLVMDGASKKPASFDIVPTLYGSNTEIFIKSESTNVTVDGNTINVRAPGEATIKLYTTSEPFITTYYGFNIVENGYNVYNYNDLLMATNFSSEVKNVVMQVTLESLKNTYKSEKIGDGAYIYKQEKIDNKANVELFGNFNFAKQTFNFENEYKLIESSYNTRFIDQFNKANNTNVSKNIVVGIDLRGDIYGNGYTINAHDLAYPNHGKIAKNGKLTPTKGKDYFFGPLGYVSIGNLAQMPVVKAYGQDNALIYMNGDNLTINDINLRSSNEIDNMYNLIYTGSVIDVNGHNNTIKNSVVSNGRTVVRAFDADGLTIENCILKNAAEFILKVGSTNVNPYNTNKIVKAEFDDVAYEKPFEEFFNIYNEDSPINRILDPLIVSGPAINSDKILSTLHQLQDALDNADGLINNNEIVYSDNINVKNSYFNNSGIFSIAFESTFNGPYLLNGGSSMIAGLVSMFNSITPEKIGGTSSPVQVNIDKNTKFYDWKAAETIDASILIEENIVEILETMDKELDLTMDDYFPMKTLLMEAAKKKGYVYHNENKHYVNSKVAWFGGGLNLSKLNIEENGDSDIGDELMVDITKSAFMGEHISNKHPMVLTLAKCVSMATGFHPFRFITNGIVADKPIDFDALPNIENLKNNLLQEEIL